MGIPFWANIRSPAFSITALIAPVRLRAVASGLIIEKVRSIAMISSLISADGRLRGLYRRRPRTASGLTREVGCECQNHSTRLRRIHDHEPFLQSVEHLRS